MSPVVLTGRCDGTNSERSDSRWVPERQWWGAAVAEGPSRGL